MTGGLLGDLAEGVKWAGDEIAEIPQALEDGWNEGLMVTPTTLTEPAPLSDEQVATNKAELQQEIDKLLALQKAQEKVAKTPEGE